MTRLKGAPEALAGAYDQALLDLDGVVYLLSQPIPEAAATLAALPGLDCDPVFVTNNASRSPEVVAEALRVMDIPAEESQVLTSAQVVAEILRERLGEGGLVLVAGSEALRAAVESQGLVATTDPKAAQGIGYGMIPSMTWRDLADLTIAARNGALWVATNLDATLPTPDGPLPGTGALAGAISTALGRGPDVVAGKPEPGIYRSALARKPGARAVMVGDRPDSDIEGANRAGIDSLLVFTGVATPRLALALPPEQRPTYLGWSLAALTEPHPEPDWNDAVDRIECGGWSATLEGKEIRLRGEGADLDAWRALCELSWAAADMAGYDPATAPVPEGAAAEKLLSL
ncbi:HAD-IIA family hydrolase [Glycomyces algeriensis]|uniref:Haloacid dehalogenase n=1 Tax=Glycomyces algeriensis TaxID=256037 RepID=A0A9W6LGF5_9ACTN|nr:HAD-IIA family hydrolase [Glycomyces algeriensis]MDA1364191.1 HAD-IIA family hydrolase [Glycomyces algeriensis]MDR7350216.1 HAD superfamily hydrolase (TIGR01450 family) [Glycomyces algeriensis]GLI42927.1 haloacid dehalogenase [Glycomyces algeriensis]